MRLALALVVFLGFGLAMSSRMMVFSEEFIILPTPPRRVLAQRPGPDGHLREEPSCRGERRLRALLSGERPTLSLCVGSRRLPIMAAPQFAGFFLWPLELLRPLHHDDPLALRRLLLSVGALSIALGYRLVARLGGRRLAAFAALATAASPCFVSLTAMIQHFETLPWIWLLCSLLALSGCPQLAPRAAGDEPPPTARLAVAALCAGLALVANIKALFFIAPLALLALRLGVRVGVVSARQRVIMAAVAAAALLPMAAPVLMDPSMSWAQGRGGDWKSDLAANLQRPQKVLEAARDLALMGSNFGSYLTNERPWIPSLVVAVGVLVFVLVDTVRTLARRRGCVVTAACGVIMLTYLGVVTLLYTEFPANYTPLHAVYGVALGCAVDRLAGLLRSRLPAAVSVALASALIVPFAWSTVLSIRSFSEVAFVTNSRAERDMVRHLDAHPEPRSVVVTVNLLLGGVLDALSRGSVQSVQAHRWLGPCERREMQGRAEECLRERWSALLHDHAGARVVRVVMPASLAFVRRPASLLPLQVAQLERASRELGWDIRVERTFSTPSGAPAARLYRLSRPDAPRGGDGR